MIKIVVLSVLVLCFSLVGCTNGNKLKTGLTVNLSLSKQTFAEIEGEYYCGDEGSSNRVVITKSGIDAYTFYLELHSKKNTDYGGHLFEYEDKFENVFQSNDSTICEFSFSEECILKLTFQNKKCSIELSDPYYIYPVQLNECILNKVK